jgi:general secretion pathway protein D
VVVRDGAATEALSLGRYEQMRINQQGFQPAPTGALPVNGSAVLPALAVGGSEALATDPSVLQPHKP